MVIIFRITGFGQSGAQLLSHGLYFFCPCVPRQIGSVSSNEINEGFGFYFFHKTRWWSYVQDVNLISVAQLKAYGEWRLIFFFFSSSSKLKPPVDVDIKRTITMCGFVLELLKTKYLEENLMHLWHLLQTHPTKCNLVFAHCGPFSSLLPLRADGAQFLSKYLDCTIAAFLKLNLLPQQNNRVAELSCRSGLTWSIL